MNWVLILLVWTTYPREGWRAQIGIILNHSYFFLLFTFKMRQLLWSTETKIRVSAIDM